MANNILLESGSTTLLESGSDLQLESGTADVVTVVLSPLRYYRRFPLTSRRGRYTYFFPPTTTAPTTTCSLLLSGGSSYLLLANARDHLSLAVCVGDMVPFTLRYQRLYVQPVRRRGTTVVPAQVNPPIVIEVSQPRITRGLLRRRRPIEVVQRQFNPPIIFTVSQRRVLRGLRRFPGRRAEIVPAQVVLANPAFVFTRSQRRVIRAALRRGHTVNFVPAQVTIPNPTFPFPGARTVRRLAGWLRRAGRDTPFIYPSGIDPVIVEPTTGTLDTTGQTSGTLETTGRTQGVLGS